MHLDEKLTIPEFVTERARLSAFEDIKTRTLSRIPGIVAKLLYLAELRDEDGSYHHWGHARVHGEVASKAALARIHAELYAELLRTPISDLAEEGSEETLRDWQRQVARLLEVRSKVVPVDSNNWSTLHFNSVVLALRMLSVGNKVSTRPAALQLQPPAQ